MSEVIHAQTHVIKFYYFSDHFDVFLKTLYWKPYSHAPCYFLGAILGYYIVNKRIPRFSEVKSCFKIIFMSFFNLSFFRKHLNGVGQWFYWVMLQWPMIHGIMLKVQGTTHWYQHLHILEDVSFGPFALFMWLVLVLMEMEES